MTTTDRVARAESGQVPRASSHAWLARLSFALAGVAVAILSDAHKPAGAGSTIFIPRGVWHGIEPVKQDSQVLWIVSAPGLEGFFREISGKQFTPAEMQDIARKHGMVLGRQ